MILSRPVFSQSTPPVPTTAATVSSLVMRALREEAELTPKPGLVDQRSSGCHADMHIGLLLESVTALQSGFLALTHAAYCQPVSVALREQLGDIGRKMDRRMLAATRGVNTHRGAIWALGLLSSAAVTDPFNHDPQSITQTAAQIARLPDRFAPPGGSSNGAGVARLFGETGAYGEACAAFPHVIRYGLPELHTSRCKGVDENASRLNALLAIMSRLPDTCLLHRGGQAALDCAQSGAAQALALGGMATLKGKAAMQSLDQALLQIWASPGGSADLLAATLFLDSLQTLSATALHLGT